MPNEDPAVTPTQVSTPTPSPTSISWAKSRVTYCSVLIATRFTEKTAEDFLREFPSIPFGLQVEELRDYPNRFVISVRSSKDDRLIGYIRIEGFNNL